MSKDAKNPEGKAQLRVRAETYGLVGAAATVNRIQIFAKELVALQPEV
jgi:hypothetical protein